MVLRWGRTYGSVSRRSTCKTLAVECETGTLGPITPHGVAFDAAGRMLVADCGSDRIVRYRVFMHQGRGTPARDSFK
jgi:hypothetical protein